MATFCARRVKLIERDPLVNNRTQGQVEATMLQTTPQDAPTTESAKKKDPPKNSTITVDPTMYTKEEAFEATLDYFDGDELAANVWVTKYALQNLEGDILEQTPADMHRRLAREFARIERNYPNPLSESEIYELFDRFRYVVPQGSPMSGIGNPYKFQSISNCFIAGTPVLTTLGIKPIEEVVVGDRVVTHTGRVRTVQQTHTNRLEGRQLFTFKAFRTPEVTVTGNHKFWSVTQEQLDWGEGPQWNAIEHLRKGDWIAIPKNIEALKPSSQFDVASILEALEFESDSITYEFDVQETAVMMIPHWTQTSRAGNEFNVHRDMHPVNRYWTFDANFARFLGLWYGDGCVFSQDKQSARVRGVAFTFGAHERDLIGFVSEFGEQFFGIPADINEHNAENDGTVQVVFHSGLVGRVFEHMWGRSYGSKRFHPSMYEWDVGRFEALLAGLVEADGTVTATGDVRVVMGNEPLIDSFYHLARSFGMPLGRSSSTVRYEGEHRTYARLDFPKYTQLLDRVHKTYEDDRIERARAKAESTANLKEIDGCSFVRLDKKFRCSDDQTHVYTFGVEEDHSYSVQGLVAQNCFVIESPADSYGGILAADQEQVQLMKRRGGVGFDLSTIRPKGLPTANAAHTTDGIEIFIERFSNSCREVAQKGRRGALMLTLDVHHPQVRDFAKIKRNRTKVTGANISIRLSDEFMEAVEKGDQVQLRWPCEPGVKHVIERWEDAREIWNEIIESAHGCAEPGILFWGNAKRFSPADIYVEEGFGSTSTNPCLTGETFVAVADGRGFVPFVELAGDGRDVPVYCCDEAGRVVIRSMRRPRKTGTKPVFKITLDDGTQFRCTGDHKFLLRDGTYEEARNLCPGTSLHVGFRSEASIKDRWPKVGHACGQDYFWLSNRNSSYQKGEHRLIWEANNGPIPRDHVVHHVDFNSQNNAVENLACMPKREHDELHAVRMRGDVNPVHAVLAHPVRAAAERTGISTRRGPTTASDPLRRLQYYRTVTNLPLVIFDGGVLVEKTCEECGSRFHVAVHRREQAHCSHACSNRMVTRDHRESHLARIQRRHVNRMRRVRTEQLDAYTELQFEIGRAPLRKEWETRCKDRGVSVGIRRTLKHGFRSYGEVQEAAAGHNHRVVAVEPGGVADVFNGTVDDFHNFYIGGNIAESKYGKPQRVLLNTANCGEIILSPNDSCRLMVINLANLVTDPFTPEADFDWKTYHAVVVKAQRLMDDMIDLELEQVDKIIGKIESDPEPEHVKRHEFNLWKKIRDSAVRGRRTGLGVTAVGDTVAMMNLRYGSDDSIDFVEKVYRALAVASYDSSVTMAEERGGFPVYNFRKEQGHPFIERVIEAGGPDLRARYEKHGRRNIANTTTAPCGSVSVLTQTTSGIEPAYLVLYTRRKKVNPDDKDVKVDFTDLMGDSWMEFTVRHHGFTEWQKATGKGDDALEESPYWKATTNDVDWVQKVKMQGAAQRWICHAISNTTNLPADVDVETVKQVYVTGWKSGCKGVTVYRDGSRSGVLVASKHSFVQHDAPKRSDRLPCEVHRSSIKVGVGRDGHPIMQDWIFFVGLYEGKPFEIFGGTTENVEIPKKVERGAIVKRSFKNGGKYDFWYGEGDDPTKIKDVVRQFDNPDQGWATRMISLSLRHGSPIQYIVEQLQRDKDADMFAFSKSIARVLKKYIPDGTPSNAEKVCPECEAENSFIYEEGCSKCLSCGASKCG
jgi:ribonucleotide reductase alpha subunit